MRQAFTALAADAIAARPSAGAAHAASALAGSLSSADVSADTRFTIGCKHILLLCSCIGAGAERVCAAPAPAGSTIATRFSFPELRVSA
mgnify:CR=1 FL=1